MKLTISKDDVQALKDKYSNSGAAGGFIEEYKLIAFPLPKYYVILIDDTNLTLVQTDSRFQEKAVTVVPLNTIQSVKLSGMMNKRVTIKTDSETYKLIMRTLLIGLRSEQADVIDRLKQLA